MNEAFAAIPALFIEVVCLLHYLADGVLKHLSRWRIAKDKVNYN
jgi:hypothetical protein